MKKHVLLFTIFLAVITCHNVSAKIWRVNNNTGITADFTTLQDAHDGAASGDTIHLESSPSSYGSLTATKKVIIIGTGYFLDQNPTTQAIKLPSKVSGITFNDGSAGSVVIGLDFQGSSISVYANDITIRRNKFSSPNGDNPVWGVGTIGLLYANNDGNQPVTNIIISQNYACHIYSSYASTGLLITNNYITTHGYFGDETTNPSLSLHANAIALIQNNIFGKGKVSVSNSSFFNNIMVVGSLEGTGNLISNNIGNSTQFGSANGNKQNVDMATVFVGAGENVSDDGQFKLKAGSPAIGAGYGSTQANPIDAGMFGGSTPYVLSGLPPVPVIYFFENQPVGSSTDPIDVTIRVKSVN